MRRKNQRGSTLVETSLVVVSFLAVMIGIVDFSQFLYTHHALTHRAREGARWASVQSPLNTDLVKNYVVYGAGAGANSPLVHRLTTAMVTVVPPVPQGAGAPQSTWIGCDGAKITVQISGYRYSIISPYIANNNMTAATIKATAPYEGQAAAGARCP
ncbi:MAG: pilus assembly protein [Bryobacterales bacterium]|nr:pilus assembly protein [Bryobacterales bacterium]